MAVTETVTARVTELVESAVTTGDLRIRIRSKNFN